jgi:hypothetical protein
MQIYFELRSYGELLGTVLFDLQEIPKEGDEIEVNFDDQNIQFTAGAWERPSGLYSFTAHEIDDWSFPGDLVIVCEFAYDDAILLETEVVEDG